MNGEEAINLARWHAQDTGISTYIELNRALREYCQATDFPWLREVEGAAMEFVEGVQSYTMPDIQLRRLERVFTQHPDSEKWEPLDESDLVSFERTVQENRDADGNDRTRQPLEFTWTGTELRVVPTPDQTYAVRFDGIVGTPVIERLGELPGPSEYHEIVPLLAAGFEIQREARSKLRVSAGELDIAVANGLMQMGRDLEQRAMAKLPKVTRDANSSRMRSLSWGKTPISR